MHQVEFYFKRRLFIQSCDLEIIRSAVLHDKEWLFMLNVFGLAWNCFWTLQVLPVAVIFSLAFQSLGVVYGDLGTSPLYVFGSTFPHSVMNRKDLIGALSLVIYTITLIPLVKYIFIVLRANDNGEGIQLLILHRFFGQLILSLHHLFSHVRQFGICFWNILTTDLRGGQIGGFILLALLHRHQLNSTSIWLAVTHFKGR
jgi:hypothetical protein